MTALLILSICSNCSKTKEIRTLQNGNNSYTSTAITTTTYNDITTNRTCEDEKQAKNEESQEVLTPTPIEPCDGLDNDGDGMIDEADVSLPVVRPCSEPFRLTPNCIGMIDMRNDRLEKFEGPLYCKEITKIVQREYFHYLSFIADLSFSSELFYSNNITDEYRINEIYFVKVTSEDVLKEYCTDYDISGVDLSRFFLVILSNFFSSMHTAEIGLASRIKADMSTKKVYVDILPYLEPIVQLPSGMAKYGWDAFVLPKKYLDFKLIFVRPPNYYIPIDYCPYSIELSYSPELSSPLYLDMIDIREDLSECNKEESKAIVEKYKINYPFPITTTFSHEITVTYFWDCDNKIGKGKAALKPDMNINFLKAEIRDGMLFLFGTSTDKMQTLPVLDEKFLICRDFYPIICGIHYFILKEQ